MARCADGFAQGGDPASAVAAAVTAALEGLHGRDPDLAFVFVSGADPETTENALLHADRLLGRATVVGCGADDVLSGTRRLDHGLAVSVWLASTPHARLRSFHLEVLRTDVSLAVVGMPPRLTDDACVVLLADPWSFPAEGFVSSSGDALDGLPLVGGLVGGEASGHARMLVDGRVVDRGAVGVSLGGDICVRTAVAHAARPVGPPMTVTASEGDAVLALAGRPATDRIAAVLDEISDNDQALASAGLLIGAVLDEYVDHHGLGDFAVQAVLGGDPDTKAILLADPLAVGTTVRLHVVDPVGARQDLDAAIAGAVGADEVEGALLFSGAPRRTAYGDPDGDLKAMRAATAAQGVSGIVTSGGIGPLHGDNHVLGFASSVLVLGQSVPDRVLAG